MSVVCYCFRHQRNSRKNYLQKNDYTLLSSLNCVHEVPWLNEAFFISIQSIHLPLSSSHSLFRKNNIEFSDKKRICMCLTFLGPCKEPIGSVLHQPYFCLWSLKKQQVSKSFLGSAMRSDHWRNPRHGVFQPSGIYRLQESSTAVKPSLQGEISWRTVTQ